MVGVRRSITLLASQPSPAPNTSLGWPVGPLSACLSHRVLARGSFRAAPSGGRRDYGRAPSLLRGARACSVARRVEIRPSANPLSRSPPYINLRPHEGRSASLGHYCLFWARRIPLEVIQTGR